MAVPKKRHTKGKRNNRRMHIFLEKTGFVSCPKCGKKHYLTLFARVVVITRVEK